MNCHSSLREKCAPTSPPAPRNHIAPPWSRNLHWGCPSNNQGNFGAKVVGMLLKYQWIMTIGSYLTLAVAFPCSVGMFLLEKEQCKMDHQHLKFWEHSSTWVRNFENIKTWKLHYGSIWIRNTSKNCKDGILKDNNLRSNEGIEFKSNENFKNYDVG
jgi:hypothetical protein